MVNFAPEMKQTNYGNPVREDFEMEIDQVGVSNADLLGQVFGGAAEVSKNLYGYAQKAEKAEAKASAERLKKLEEQKKAKTQAAYNDFYRKKQRINEAVEQNRMSWTAADTATRRLMDEYSRVEGIEYSKLLQGVEASDFTGSYDREKETRKFWNTKKNEQQNKVWETMTAANPYLMDIFSPEEGMAWVNHVNDTYDTVEKYAAELNTIDQYTDPAKYDRVSSEMMRAAGNNIQAALIADIFDEKGKINSSSKLQETKVRLRDKYLKLGMPAWRVDTSIDIGFRRSGIEAKVDAVNKQHTLNDEDVKRWVKAGQNQFLVAIGATENPYIAMWTNTDDFKSGRIYTETTRKYNIELGKRMSKAISGYFGEFTPIPDDIKGEVYGGYANVIKGNVGTPTLKGFVLKDLFTDAKVSYADKDAETRRQAYKEILSKFDNVYTDANIKALKADARPEARMLGEEIGKDLERIRNLKKFADFEVTSTSAANSWNLLKEGPGMDLLRVNDEGHIVMVDGSKGLLQSTAITLSDATGRYFGAAEDLNEYFSEIYKDPQKRIEMFKDAGIPELDQMKETVIGRKEWYLGTGKAKTEEDIAKEKAVAELDAQWKGRPKMGAYWKARREIEDSFAGEPYNLLDLPGDIVEGVGTGLKKAGKGIIKGAQGIGVGINRLLGNKTIWDKEEIPTEIDKLEKTLENEDLKPHIRRAVEGTIEILKNQDGTSTARYSRSEPLTFAHMETPEVYKLTEEGTKAENKLLQSMGEHDTFLGVAEEGLYQERKKSLPKALQSEEDYDLRGAYKAGLLDNVEEGMHLPDTFKKPNHITFSKESKYYEDGMWAGEWTEAGDFMIPLATPKAKLAKLKEYFAKYEPNAMIVIDNPPVLKQLKEVEAEEDRISDYLSTEDLSISEVEHYEKEKEALMNKRHRLWKLVYIQP